MREGVIWTEKPSDQLAQQRVGVNSSPVNGIVSIGSGFTGLHEFLSAIDIRVRRVTRSPDISQSLLRLWEVQGRN